MYKKDQVGSIVRMCYVAHDRMRGAGRESGFLFNQAFFVTMGHGLVIGTDNGAASILPRRGPWTFYFWMWSLARPQTLLENRGRAYARIWALVSWIFRISIAKSTY